MNKDEKKKGCRVEICEDPETGEIIAKPDAGCPRGYVEKLREKVMKADKLIWYLPKDNETREMPEEDDK
jgi:lactate dehydrogenase-like 2-hydroxyacid dehydrogenase